MLGLTFSSKLDCGSYIISIAKTASKKIGTLISSMKFLSPEVALYLYKSTIQPCMEYCCHVWAGAPICYLELLYELQKQICWIVGPSFASSFEPLIHCGKVASLKWDSHLQKDLCYLLHWKPFKSDEKCFLFHFNSSFHSQDIEVFVMSFRSCRKNTLIRMIRLVSKFMVSQPG